MDCPKCGLINPPSAEHCDCGFDFEPPTNPDYGLGDIAYVVTLVHGTFARRAGWLENEAPLSRHLERSLPGRVFVTSYHWSGRNSISARLWAAAGLRRDLLSKLRKHPHARHYLVGHSHGGNVILRALRGGAIANRVQGVVLLSTPFLYFRRRDPALVRNFLGASFLALPSLGAFYLRALTDTSALSFLFVWALFAAGIFALWSRVYPRLHIRAMAMIERLSLPDSASMPLLVLRRPGDEASGVLATASFLAYVLERLWKLVPWLVRWSDRRLGARLFRKSGAAWPIFGGILLVLSFIGSHHFIGSRYHEVVFWPLLGLLIFVVLVWASPVIGGVLALPTIAFSALLLCAFGPELAWLSLFADVAIDSCPPGYCVTYQLAPKERAFNADQMELQEAHGSTHSDPDAVRVIADWLVRNSIVPVA
jgi:hypothetical protein